MAEPIPSRWTAMRPFAVTGPLANLAVWALLLIGGVAVLLIAAAGGQA